MVMKERHCCGQAAEETYYLGGSAWPRCGGKAKTKEDGMEGSPAEATGLNKSAGRSSTCIPGHGKGALRMSAWEMCTEVE